MTRDELIGWLRSHAAGEAGEPARLTKGDVALILSHVEALLDANDQVREHVEGALRTAIVAVRGCALTGRRTP